MKKIKIILSIFIMFCLLFSFFGCKREAERREKIFFGCFDTVCTVYSYAGDTEEDFAENCREIEKFLEKYHRLFDIYNEYDGINNLCTLNKHAGGEALEIDRELIDFLLYAKELYAKTNGEMNIMMGSVLSLWHQCRTDASNGNLHLPDDAALSEAGKHTSIDLLEIDEQSGTVRITDPQASVDVGALGKGYAAEMIAKYLEGVGAEGYVLDLGGNIRAIGSKPNGDGWVTGIRSPFSAEQYSKKLILSDTSCVTSGNYERYFELDGVKYHHIIDKDTLNPAKYFASVTVITKNSALADALSTALYCMSYEDGLATVEAIGDVEVLWIFNDGSMYMTDGLSALEAENE